MAIYMKYGKTNASKLNSSEWGDSGGAARGSTSRERSPPSLSEVTVNKFTHGSSPKPMLQSAAGKLDNKIAVKFTTKDKVESLTTCKFTDRGAGGHSLDRHGAQSEASISLNFTRITRS